MDKFFASDDENFDLLWIDLSGKLASGIQNISKNVSVMQKMLSKIGTEEDTPDFKIDFDTIENYTQEIVKETFGYLKDLKSLPSILLRNPKGAKLEKRRLQDEFVSTMNNYRLLQKNYIRKVKNEMKRGSTHDKSRDQAYHESHSGHKDDQAHHKLTHSQMRDVVRVMDEGREYSRERKHLEGGIKLEHDITAMKRDIIDTRKLYKEINALNKEQSVMIDTINHQQSNVDRTGTSVQRGTQHEPRVSQNKYLKKKYILPTVGAVIIMVVVISIIVWLLV